MKRKHDWRYILGAALLLVVIAVILLTFWRMSRPGAKELDLTDLPDERFGWRYELLEDGQTRAYEPTFEDGFLAPELPEGIQAVRITRRMTEEIPIAELEWHSYKNGVEVFLDGELLHTDFRGRPQRGENGFLMLTDEDWELLREEQGDVWKRVRLSLPADYLGRELSMITYFAED